jgi:hypothetical protein
MLALLCTPRLFMSHARRIGYRLAVLTAPMILISMTACGDDDDDDGTVVTGEYELSEVNGDELPAAVEEAGGTRTFTNGTITLDADGEWTLNVESDLDGVDEVLDDNGTYTSSDGNIDFSSDAFNDEFTGTLDGETLEIDYDRDGDGVAETDFTFNRT